MKKMINTLINFFALIAFISRKTLSVPQDTARTLEKCIHDAFEQNIQVRKNILPNETTVLYTDQVRAQRFPSLSASVNQNYNLIRSTAPAESGYTSSNGTNYSVNTGIILFNYSRISYLIKKVELDIESGVYSLETTKETISLSILNAFYKFFMPGSR